MNQIKNKLDKENATKEQLVLKKEIDQEKIYMFRLLSRVVGYWDNVYERGMDKLGVGIGFLNQYNTIKDFVKHYDPNKKEKEISKKETTEETK